MGQSIQEIIEDINRETKKIWMEEPDDVKRLRLGFIPSGAGTYGQYFSTFVFADGEVRDLGIYCLTTIYQLSKDPQFELAHLRRMARTLLPVPGEFVGYCGLEKVWDYVGRYLGIIDSIESRDELRELTLALMTYVNRVHGWIHFYFPWGLGALYPLRSAEDVEEMAKVARYDPLPS